MARKHVPSRHLNTAKLIQQGCVDYWTSLSTSPLPCSKWQLNVSGAGSLPSANAPSANAGYHSPAVHLALSFLDQHSIRSQCDLMLIFEFRALSRLDPSPDEV